MPNCGRFQKSSLSLFFFYFFLFFAFFFARENLFQRTLLLVPLFCVFLYKPSRYVSKEVKNITLLFSSRRENSESNPIGDRDKSRKGDKCLLIVIIQVSLIMETVNGVVDQDQKWLLNCLSATLDSNQEVRSFAEASLDQASHQSGFEISTLSQTVSLFKIYFCCFIASEMLLS